jgi:hypothetical protein
MLGVDDHERVEAIRGATAKAGAQNRRAVAICLTSRPSE